jgi:hypothetical protein
MIGEAIKKVSKSLKSGVDSMVLVEIKEKLKEIIKKLDEVEKLHKKKNKQ